MHNLGKAAETYCNEGLKCFMNGRNKPQDIVEKCEGSILNGQNAEGNEYACCGKGSSIFASLYKKIGISADHGEAAYVTTTFPMWIAKRILSSNKAEPGGKTCRRTQMIFG